MKYLGQAMYLQGQQTTGRGLLLRAERIFSQYLTDHGVVASSIQGIFLYGELALFRLKALELSRQKHNNPWLSEIEDYIHDKSACLPIVDSVRNAYRYVQSRNDLGPSG